MKANSGAHFLIASGLRGFKQLADKRIERTDFSEKRGKGIKAEWVGDGKEQSMRWSSMEKNERKYRPFRVVWSRWRQGQVQ